MKLKTTLWILCLLLFACNNSKKEAGFEEDILVKSDTLEKSKAKEAEKEIPKEFSNERFRHVSLEKLDGNKYRAKGEAQIFEANFNWSVEDGHYVLKTGSAMTNAGAPEWGKFEFTFEVKKVDDYSTLLLILYEVSSEDGSYKYELPIPLP